MSLLQKLKKFNQSLISENDKLTNTYEKLITESGPIDFDEIKETNDEKQLKTIDDIKYESEQLLDISNSSNPFSESVKKNNKKQQQKDQQPTDDDDDISDEDFFNPKKELPPIEEDEVYDINESNDIVNASSYIDEVDNSDSTIELLKQLQAQNPDIDPFGRKPKDSTEQSDIAELVSGIGAANARAVGKKKVAIPRSVRTGDKQINIVEGWDEACKILRDHVEEFSEGFSIHDPEDLRLPIATDFGSEQHQDKLGNIIYDGYFMHKREDAKVPIKEDVLDGDAVKKEVVDIDTSDDSVDGTIKKYEYYEFSEKNGWHKIDIVRASAKSTDGVILDDPTWRQVLAKFIAVLKRLDMVETIKIDDPLVKKLKGHSFNIDQKSFKLPALGTMWHTLSTMDKDPKGIPYLTTRTLGGMALLRIYEWGLNNLDKLENVKIEKLLKTLQKKLTQVKFARQHPETLREIISSQDAKERERFNSARNALNNQEAIDAFSKMFKEALNDSMIQEAINNTDDLEESDVKEACGFFQENDDEDESEKTMNMLNKKDLPNQNSNGKYYPQSFNDEMKNTAQINKTSNNNDNVDINQNSPTDSGFTQIKNNDASNSVKDQHATREDTEEKTTEINVQKQLHEIDSSELTNEDGKYDPSTYENNYDQQTSLEESDDELKKKLNELEDSEMLTWDEFKQPLDLSGNKKKKKTKNKSKKKE